MALNKKQESADGTGALLGTASVCSGANGTSSSSTPANQRKSRDDDCCSVNFLKCVMDIFNGVFLLAGLAMLGIGVWTLVAKFQYASLLSTPTYQLTTWCLVAAGAIAVPLAILGCFGLRKESRGILLTYTYLLLLVFLLEATVGVLAYVYEDQVDKELHANLNNTFLSSYTLDPHRTEAINKMQMDFKCCGAIRFEDWRRSIWLKRNPKEINVVPDSCCKTVIDHCGKRDHPSNIHYNGCIRQFTNHIREHLIILGAVGLGISVIPMFGLIFSCCLYIKLKDVLD